MKTKSWQLIRTLIIAYLFTAVLLTALTFLLYKFRFPESQITIGINAVYVLSCFLGGLLAGKSMKSRRFLWGLVTGLLYFAFLLLMSYIQNQAILSDLTHILTVFAMCTLRGMAGGMIS